MRNYHAPFGVVHFLFQGIASSSLRVTLLLVDVDVVVAAGAAGAASAVVVAAPDDAIPAEVELRGFHSPTKEDGLASIPSALGK